MGFTIDDDPSSAEGADEDEYGDSLSEGKEGEGGEVDPGAEAVGDGFSSAQARIAVAMLWNR